MTRLWTIVAFLAGAGLLAAAEPANAGIRTATPELRIVIKEAEPFVFLNRNPPTGYSIELWEEVAKVANIPYSYIRVGSAGEMIDALTANKADVAVGALSITAARETEIDFSQGIYDSGLGLMVRSESKGSSLIRQIAHSQIPGLALILLVAIFINANIIWFLQRQNNSEQFPENYFKGVGEAMWWSVSMFLTGGCEEKLIIGAPARIMAVVWFLIGVTSITYVTATLASSMTLSGLDSNIHDLSELRNGEVATVEKSQAATFLVEKNLRATPYPDVLKAIESLQHGKVRAVFYDIPILRYQQDLHKNDGLEVLPAVYQPHQYGFGLETKSPYRKEINRAILTLMENGRIDALRQKWFGTDASTH